MHHKTFSAWLLKLDSKLGLTSLVTDISKGIQKIENSDYEKIGCVRFSHYSDFGVDKELE